MSPGHDGAVGLSASLSQNQIQAAGRLYHRLDRWRLADEALRRLHQSMPGFAPEECLLKAVAINQLYGTNVLAIIPMSRHVHRTLSDIDIAAQRIELVDRIAAFSHNGIETTRISFASKFCHFFVDEERFPLYDKAARETLKLHLGRAYLSGIAFAAFCKNFQQLREASGVRGGTRDIDRYLWIVGSYMAWKKSKYINTEIRQAFESPSSDVQRDLEELLPVGLQR
jgi:hypothetical protein